MDYRRRIKRETLEEGEIFCKWLHSRLIKNNKNVLSVELGPTGSGKSWRDLRKAELWYRYHFKKDFPVKNICFGVEQAMELISSGKLKRGEIIIMEEAGVNLGAMDFQNKTVKLFNYVLQSFRSMNIAIFFNLPYLNFLSKQARMLLHFSSESISINKEEGKNSCKPFRHQVNQGTGKIYKKYFIVKVNNKGSRKVKMFSWSKPSDYLIDAYEQKKKEYLDEQNKDFHGIIKEIKNKGKPQVILKPIQIQAYHMRQNGMKLAEIGEIIGRETSVVSRYVKKVKENFEKGKEKHKITPR